MGGLAYQFPFLLGESDETQTEEHNALLEALAPAFDVTEGTELWCEAYADATAIAAAWSACDRLRSQGIPLRMLETLSTWERSLGLRPTVQQTDVERRQSVDAKFRGLSHNAYVDIEEAVRDILGDNLVHVIVNAPADAITYWPGINPGPPGYEWTTSTARLCVVMTEDGLSPGTLERKKAAVVTQLNTMLPAWQTFVVGVGSSFVVSVGIVGKTLL